jgi:SAM-dependent methyltransferase
MRIPDLQGLKFPDEYISRFFFKEKLNQNIGSVLELGCGNANNLLLFYEYGWNVTGVDIDTNVLKQAADNFSLTSHLYNHQNTFCFDVNDMLEFVEKTEKSYDIVLMPGSFYYSDIFYINKLFQLIQKKNILKENGLLFLRFRTPKDYRYGKGERLGSQTFRFDFNETGELNCINTFFKEHEMIELLNKYFKLDRMQLFRIEFDNIQQDTMIHNSDVIVWANINSNKPY